MASVGDVPSLNCCDCKMPEFWYHGYDGKYHRYYPDIYVVKDNLIIEVKSLWTYNIDKLKIQLTSKTVNYNGFKYCLMVFDQKGNLLPISML